MRHPATLLVTTTAVLALAACGGNGAEGDDFRGAAEPSIQSKQGIAGVRLGMTVGNVRARHGRPDARRPSDLHAGWTLWTYRARRLQVTLDGRDRVWDVRTRSRSDRTAAGLGVGSSERELRRAMPSLRCRPYGGPARYRDWRTCVDTSDYRGPFTQFTLVRGRVREVKVAQGLAF